MMSNLPKYAAYGIGAVSLVVGSFVTYSVLTGTPMNEMKAVGGLFPESVSSEEVEDGEGEAETPEEERSRDVRSPRQVYESAATPLGAFALQDPFSAEELRKLERTLQLKLDQVAKRARDLEERERLLEEDRQLLNDRLSAFEGLRNSLLEQHAENDAAADELQRGNAVLSEKKAEVYKSMAMLFQDTKAKDAAQLLTSVYGPDEAAKILVQLDDDRVRELIGAIHQLMPDEGVLYVKALQKLRGR